MHELVLFFVVSHTVIVAVRVAWQGAHLTGDRHGRNLSIGGAQPSFKPQSPARDVKPFSMSSTRPVDLGGKGNPLIESIPIQHRRVEFTHPVQPSLSDYYKDEPNPGYEPEKKRPIEPITGIPVTVPISQRGILSVVAAIYPTSLHISSSGHARDINSHG
ncbi:hypothetical protein V6N13_034921 [Hibiscus sabdariffa]|uniref:Uncharacterized protein n=1 Tax=Hibiscus sabdariffa TaxID=183260 RepID=A0ABR2AFQ4_9ROSI